MSYTWMGKQAMLYFAVAFWLTCSFGFSEAQTPRCAVVQCAHSPTQLLAHFVPVQFYAHHRLRTAAGDSCAYTDMCTNYYALRNTPLWKVMSSSWLHSLFDLHYRYDRRVISHLEAKVRELRSKGVAAQI